MSVSGLLDCGFDINIAAMAAALAHAHKRFSVLPNQIGLNDLDFAAVGQALQCL